MWPSVFENITDTTDLKFATELHHPAGTVTKMTHNCCMYAKLEGYYTAGVFFTVANCSWAVHDKK